jgi:Prohead core protein serine protease
MKLICEQNDNIIIEAVAEGAGPGKNYFIQGVFLQANLQNRNGRVYPLDILEREVSRYHNAYVAQHRALGELGHPDGPTINLDRTSHLIVDLFKEGNNFIGKAKILDTPHGKIVKSLIDEGVKLGVSSRGMGSLKENSRGIQEVQDDFYLATAADIVADPSAPAAFVQGIMEGKEWTWNNGVLCEAKLDTTKKQFVKKAPSEKQMIEAFDSFLKDLSRRSF